MQYRPHRYNTQYPITLSTPAGLQKAKVIDVNNTGARVEGVKDLIRGHKVQLDILNNKVEAIVQWAAGSRAGITFRPQITDMQVDTLRYRQDGRRASHRIGYAEMR